MIDLVNTPPWESEVLQWLNDVVARQQQKQQQINTSQLQYDLSLVAKITSYCNQLSVDTPGMSISMGLYTVFSSTINKKGWGYVAASLPGGDRNVVSSPNDITKLLPPSMVAPS